MNDGQIGGVCPQCGSAAAVHSIGEFAEMARGQLGGQGQPGYAGQPQSGPVPGYPGQPRSGPVPGRGGRSGGSGSTSGDAFSLGDDLADIAMTAATQFLGRAIGRRMQRALGQQVNTLAARNEAIVREKIAIAERHPDLRACWTDKVIFLAGGSRVLPLKDVNVATLTVEQSDAIVAQLRDG